MNIYLLCSKVKKFLHIALIILFKILSNFHCNNFETSCAFLPNSFPISRENFRFIVSFFPL